MKSKDIEVVSVWTAVINFFVGHEALTLKCNYNSEPK